MVTIENWEEYAILKADGELDAAGQAALEAFLAAHPELQEEAKLFDSLKLVPDEEIVFSGKEALLKSEPKMIVLNTRRVMWAAAAGVALLLGATLLLRNGGEGTGATGGVVAGAAKINAPTAPVQKQPVVAPQAPVPPQPVEAQHESSPVLVRKRTIPTQQTPTTPQEAPLAPQPVEKPDNSNIAVLPQNEANPMPVEPVQVQPQINPSVNDVAPSENKKVPNKLLDRIAFADDKLRLVDDLKVVASNSVQTLRSTREKLRNADVTFQVGNRDLFTIHF